MERQSPLCIPCQMLNSLSQAITRLAVLMILSLNTSETIFLE